jgi:hypothetical protein
MPFVDIRSSTSKGIGSTRTAAAVEPVKAPEPAKISYADVLGTAKAVPEDEAAAMLAPIRLAAPSVKGIGSVRTPTTSASSSSPGPLGLAGAEVSQSIGGVVDAVRDALGGGGGSTKGPGYQRPQSSAGGGFQATAGELLDAGVGAAGDFLDTLLGADQAGSADVPSVTVVDDQPAGGGAAIAAGAAVLLGLGALAFVATRSK